MRSSPRWKRLWVWIAGFDTVRGLLEWSGLGKSIAAGLALVLTFVAGLLQDVPITFVVPGSLLAAGAVLWVGNQWTFRKHGLQIVQSQTLSSAAAPQHGDSLPWATKEELAAPLVERKRVRLLDVVSDSGSPLISNKEFRQCLLIGPAFLGAVAPPGPTLLGRQIIDAPVSSVVVPMEPKPTSGVIGLIAVTFNECAFQRVGFGVPPSGLKHWRESWTLAIGGFAEESSPSQSDQETSS